MNANRRDEARRDAGALLDTAVIARKHEKAVE